VIMKEPLLRRFLHYVKIDTQSDPYSGTFPSTRKQFDLADLLVNELNKIGMNEVALDKNGYVIATLPSNTSKKIPVVGFLAHMDTSPDMSGAQVNPQIIEKYDGNNILLNSQSGLELKTSDFPEILNYKGQTLITTDGTTLLGADDKAGIAEIVTAMEYLIRHPEIQHGTIKVAFTPDEEVGKGVDYFEPAKFGADYAYTMDGGAIGELEFENFNAAKAVVNIQGRNIHPGSAKNKMLNAILIAHEFNSLLPVEQRPEFTDHYEGFYHIHKIEGTVEEAMMEYIIRDHDTQKFSNKKDFIHQIAGFLNKKYPEETVRVTVTDQYFNMREKIEPVMHIVETAREAMKAVGVDPIVKPIRGGTDGARLSYMGLPCPNIFAGGHNFHGKYEFVPLESMVKAVEVIVKIASMYAEK
jgi:tripeptide aminopeptidase